MELDVKKAVEILREGPAVDFEKLLDPYREGGLEKSPKERTWGLILEWLIAKHSCPPETAGAALILALLQLKDGMVFEGDGSYGSKGHQLDRHILTIARAIEQKKDADAFYEILGRRAMSIVEKTTKETLEKRIRPWWLFWDGLGLIAGASFLVFALAYLLVCKGESIWHFVTELTR